MSVRWPYPRLVKKSEVHAWRDEATCPEGHRVEVFYTLPDFGDAPHLYQCPQSGDLFSVSPDAEEYVGPQWDLKRQTAACPTCAASLEYAHAFPDAFRCPECGALGRYEIQGYAYPEESRSVTEECWDPYASD